MKKRRYWQILGLLVIAGIAMLAAAHAGKTPRLAAEVAMQARLYTAGRRSSSDEMREPCCRRQEKIDRNTVTKKKGIVT